MYLPYSFNNYQFMANPVSPIPQPIPYSSPDYFESKPQVLYNFIHKYLSKYLYKTRTPISKQNDDTIIRLVSTIIS